MLRGTGDGPRSLVLGRSQPSLLCKAPCGVLSHKEEPGQEAGSPCACTVRSPGTASGQHSCRACPLYVHLHTPISTPLLAGRLQPGHTPPWHAFAHSQELLPGGLDTPSRTRFPRGGAVPAEGHCPHTNAASFSREPGSHSLAEVHRPRGEGRRLCSAPTQSQRPASCVGTRSSARGPAGFVHSSISISQSDLGGRYGGLGWARVSP